MLAARVRVCVVPTVLEAHPAEAVPAVSTFHRDAAFGVRVDDVLAVGAGEVEQLRHLRDEVALEAFLLHGRQ